MRSARHTLFVLRIIISWLPLINVERVHKIIPTQPVLKSTEQVKPCPCLLGQITTGSPSRLVFLRVSSYYRVVLLVNLEILVSKVNSKELLFLAVNGFFIALHWPPSWQLLLI